MTWANPQLVKVIPRDVGVDLVVVFVNDALGQKLEKTYTVDFINPPADWLARRVTDTLAVLNSVDIFAKLFQPGSITPFVLPDPTPEEAAQAAFFSALMLFQRLSDPNGMGQIDAAKADRDAAKADVEAKYLPIYFGIK